jgi:DNA-binding NarL/FixJ family response regulator
MTIEPSPIRVLIVDDHTVVRFGLAAIIALQPDMAVAGEAASAEEACALCQERLVDVVLMDLRLPGASGVDAIRTIRALRPTIRFIVLTTYAGDEDIHRALDAGAHAYLLKGMSHAEVTSAVRKVHSGGRVIPEAVSKTLAQRRPQSQLSPREVEVLQLIAGGCSNKEIREVAREHHPQPPRRRRPHAGHRRRAAAGHSASALRTREGVHSLIGRGALRAALVRGRGGRSVPASVDARGCAHGVTLLQPARLAES